jgi:catechol 2,3-dioxygenase-like lactoylglutathione lyase family enzyme
MEVLSSRVLLQPVDFERSLQFYSESLGLHVYHEWGRGHEGRGFLPWGRLLRALWLLAHRD